MKRRKLALLLTSAMVAGLLSGCGGDGGSTAVDQSNASQSTESTGSAVSEGTSESSGGEEEAYTDDKGNQFRVASDGTEYYVDKDGNEYQKFDDVKLSWLSVWDGGVELAEDQYNSEVAQKIRDRIGVTVEIEGFYGDEDTKLNQLFASGEMPDVIDAPYWGGATTCTVAIQKAARDGLLNDLSGIVDNYNWLPQGYDYENGYITETYYQRDLDIDGGLYALPRELDSKEEVTPSNYAVLVRADVAETLNVDPQSIHTAEELYDFMKAADEYGFKDVNGNDTITAGTRGQGNYYRAYQTPFVQKHWTGLVPDENGNLVYELTDESFIMDGNLFIWRLVNEGLFDKECFTQSEDLAEEKCGNGSVLFVGANYNGLLNIIMKSGLYDAHPEMRYVPVGPLNFVDGSEFVVPEEAGATGSPVIIFPETCSNLEAALTYVDYISSPEGQLLLRYGTEGEDYYFDEENNLHWTEEAIAAYNEDSAAWSKERRERGMHDMLWIADNDTKWFGPYNSISEKELILFWRSLAKVEFPASGKKSIETEITKFEGYEDIVANAMDQQYYKDMTQRAFFAETEEEAREILQEYVDHVNNTAGYQDLMNYLTEIYKADPDAYYY